MKDQWYEARPGDLMIYQGHTHLPGWTYNSIYDISTKTVTLHEQRPPFDVLIVKLAISPSEENRNGQGQE